MKFDDFDDYFDGPEIEEKKEPLTPEQIEDKIDEENTITLHTHRWRNIAIAMIAVVVLGVALALFFRYFSPYVSDAQETGYVMKIEKRGLLFKTYEGEMVSETTLLNDSKVYQRDFVFSFDNDSLALRAMELQGKDVCVILKYKSYDGVLPWRGESRNIITAVTPTDAQAAMAVAADPSLIEPEPVDAEPMD